jgi:hypothetical protein
MVDYLEEHKQQLVFETLFQNVPKNCLTSPGYQRYSQAF